MRASVRYVVSLSKGGGVPAGYLPLLYRDAGGTYPQLLYRDANGVYRTLAYKAA